MYPGNCWAFRGSQGYLVVRLSMEVRLTSFALEHIPKTLSPTGNITSAPRDFSVYVSVPGAPSPGGAFPRAAPAEQTRTHVMGTPILVCRPGPAPCSEQAGHT